MGISNTNGNLNFCVLESIKFVLNYMTKHMIWDVALWYIVLKMKECIS